MRMTSLSMRLRHWNVLLLVVLAAALHHNVRSQVICRGSPKHPANGRFICRNAAAGESCTATCDKGYAGNPTPIASCVAHSFGQHTTIGKWTQAQGRCTRIACPGNPTQPAFGVFNCTAGFIGSRCEAKCDIGYTGSPTATCSALPGAPAWSMRGAWSAVAGTCNQLPIAGGSFCTYGAGEEPSNYIPFPDGSTGPLHECCFNDGDYCGGGANVHGDAERYHMSCTSFPARLSNLAKIQTLSWCTNTNTKVFAGPDVAIGQSRMWKALDQVTGQKVVIDDWWVFHGCDGAGLMSDCLGGFMYAEHYMNRDKPDVAYDVATDTYGPTSALPNGGRYNEVKNDPVPCTDSATCWKRHSRSFHRHPGTNKEENLDAGMWDQNEWKEKGKPWFANLGLKDPKAYYETYLKNSKCAYAAVMTYPWVCNTEWTSAMSAGTKPPQQPTAMSKEYLLKKMWGDRPNWNNNDPPFFPQQGFVDCYYDNEPWNGVHDSPEGPPIWEAYIFWADCPLTGRFRPNQVQQIYGTRVAWKTKNPQVHVLTPDDKVELDNGIFKLHMVK